MYKRLNVGLAYCAIAGPHPERYQRNCVPVVRGQEKRNIMLPCH